MPKRAAYALIWSSSNQVYKLYEGQREHALNLISGNPAWSVWLNQVTSFAFRGQNGSYTARNERRERGGKYWYAYARINGKLTKRYLGRSTDLTLIRLEQVAQEFMPGPLTILRGSHYIHAAGGGQLGKVSGFPGRRIEISRVPSPLWTDTLLATKLHVPRQRSRLVYRPRLIQRLQNGLEKTLILLSAPAGFGKSTLLGDWLSSCTIPAAWLSLEPRDNDPTRFLSYLLAALQTSDLQLGRSVQALPHPLHHAPLESVLTLLINGLQARMSGEHEHVVLVLDDYHVITNGSIHYTLSFLLEHLPPHLHLVLATRQDPPLALARLRGRDDLLELRAGDLRFTHEETSTYLVELMGLPLSAEESALLQARTEGWITGLHLAALSLQGYADPAGFMATFSGSHHYVADYLLDEVLSRQPQARQEFLVQTSLLDRLSAPLCDALRGQHDSQAQLGLLEQANLFLVPLDEERRWYRYHHLFAEVLRQRLQQTNPALVPQLHLRASRWFEQHGLLPEAVSHALAANACGEAARLIEECAWKFIVGSQLQTLSGWLDALPMALIIGRPALRLIYALVLMHTHHLVDASTHLQAIELQLPAAQEASTAGERLLLAQVIACRSLLARLSGDLGPCVTLATQALELLPETEGAPLLRLLRAEAVLGAARAYLLSGDVTASSERVLMELVADARASESRLLIPRGLSLLARLHSLQGRLHQSAAIQKEIVQVIPEPEELHALLDSPAYYFALGDLLREWNEVDAAEQHLARGMDMLKGGVFSVDADTAWLGYAARARLLQAQGRDEQALATLEAFMRRAQQYQFTPALLSQATALRAQIELSRGQLQIASLWANCCGLSASDMPAYPREREYLTLARVLIAQERAGPGTGALPAVLLLLERLLAAAEATMRLHSALEVLLLLVLAREARGDSLGAQDTLSRALALAEPQGYVRIFLDEGPPMLALLRQAQWHEQANGYVARLLAASDMYTPDAAAPRLLIEPLTARERVVLRLVLDGASNREIASQLVLSVNTVKKHVLNIYGKLNVQSRTQAIARARSLNIL